MKIGSVKLDYPLIMAPMAGITDLPFRRIIKETGCALVTTEMISANGLVQHNKKTGFLLRTMPSERPLSVQIFGSNPGTMAEAAVIAQEKGADIVDINFGCPARKILKNASGSSLMRDPSLCRRLLAEVRKAISIPLTIKMRTGWTPSGEEALRLARIAEECGVDAVTVHPRTVAQKFGGLADWSLIARVKEISSIPIIGNGDIRAPGDVLKMLTETGCDGVMIARGALGNPWLFGQSIELLKGGSPLPITLDERKKTILRYVDYAVEHRGESGAVLILRRMLPGFVKSLPECGRFRREIVQAKTGKQVCDIVCAYFAFTQLLLSRSTPEITSAIDVC